MLDVYATILQNEQQILVLRVCINYAWMIERLFVEVEAQIILNCFKCWTPMKLVIILKLTVLIKSVGIMYN